MIGPYAKDMVCHEDAFNVVWRIALHAQDRLGRPRYGHTKREPLEQVSIESTFEQSENVAMALASWAESR